MNPKQKALTVAKKPILEVRKPILEVKLKSRNTLPRRIINPNTIA